MPTEPLTLSGRPAGTSPSTVVARLVGRRAVRSVIVWGIAFGLYVVASVSGYAKTYSTAASRAQLARRLGSNVGFEALIGPARHLETVAGFAAWRCMGVLSLVGAVWALLASTRLLRGEEEAGRWEMLLAGQTTRRRAAALGLAGLAAGWAALWAITAIVTLAEGRAAQPHFSLSASAFFPATPLSSLTGILASCASRRAATTRRRPGTGRAAGRRGAPRCSRWDGARPTIQ